jgi:hypothetical protein
LVPVVVRLSLFLRSRVLLIKNRCLGGNCVCPLKPLSP